MKLNRKQLILVSKSLDAKNLLEIKKILRKNILKSDSELFDISTLNIPLTERDVTELEINDYLEYVFNNLKKTDNGYVDEYGHHIITFRGRNLHYSYLYFFSYLNERFKVSEKEAEILFIKLAKKLGIDLNRYYRINPHNGWGWWNR